MSRRRSLVGAVIAVSTLVGVALPVGAVTSSAPRPTCQGHRATIVVKKSHVTVHGTGKSDVIVALGAGDTILAGKGNDLVCAGAAKLIDAGAGNDRVTFWGSPKVQGGSGNDVIRQLKSPAVKHVLSAHAATALAGAGNPVIHGGAGNDTIYLGPGNGQAYGDDGNDTIYGGKGKQLLSGGAGNDRLIGGLFGRFTLLGGPGVDFLVIKGGSGNFVDGGADGDFITVPLGLLSVTTIVKDALDYLNGVLVGGKPTTPTTPTTPTAPATPTLSASLLYDGSAGPVLVTQATFTCCDPFTTGFTTPAGDSLAGWSLNFGDGTPVHSGLAAPPEHLIHTYLSAGHYTATLAVRDVHGAVATTTTVVDARPLPTLHESMSNPSAGDVTLTTTGTAPATGATLAGYYVGWGDGTESTGTGALPGSLTHHYAVFGHFPVVVAVVDDHGGIAIADDAVAYDEAGKIHAHLVDVSGGATDLVPTSVDRTRTGNGIFLDLSRTSIGVAGNPTFTVTWGDGATTTTQFDPTLEHYHVYSAAGHYTITLKVTVGAVSSTATMPADVVSGYPTLSVTPSALALATGNDGQLTTHLTLPAGESVVGYDVEVDDGYSVLFQQSVPGALPATLPVHAGKPGVYSAYVDVYTSHGGFAFDSSRIYVTGSEPTMRFDAGDTRWIGVTANKGPVDVTSENGEEEEAEEESAIYFDASSILPSTGHELTDFDLDYGDGSPHLTGNISPDDNGAGVVSGEHSYAEAGEYTATIVVHETGGQSVTRSIHVSVLAGPPSIALTLSDPTPKVGETVTVTPQFDPGAGAVSDHWYVYSSQTDPFYQVGNGNPKPFDVTVTSTGLTLQFFYVTDHGLAEADASFPVTS
ncbi:MAG TPA: PKD domain-containing protein [Mycobacteriales bacterium]|nr:PKD domain-containing protein [Mycobacteriales bacterium]